jgi:hypothetical protein
MVQDIVDHLAAKARELLDEYACLKPAHTPLTFGQIERIWEEEIGPRIKDFDSMQDGPEGPPEDSRWYPNWRVPDLGQA